MKTAEEILESHLTSMLSRTEGSYVSIDEMKQVPEWEACVNAIEQAQIEAYDQALIDRDNYAMEFAKWVESLSPSDRVSVWSKDGSLSGLFYMDMEQLLCKYKSKLKK